MDLLSGISIERLQALISEWGWLRLAKTICEVLIIVYALLWIWGRIRGTQAERLVKGVLVLTLVCVLSWFFGFTLITSILQQLIPVAVLAI
jgi:DNA integrity scanning protein DisA with diadenylate cyclase activity